LTGLLLSLLTVHKVLPDFLGVPLVVPIVVTSILYSTFSSSLVFGCSFCCSLVLVVFPFGYDCVVFSFTLFLIFVVHCTGVRFRWCLLLFAQLHLFSLVLLSVADVGLVVVLIW